MKLVKCIVREMMAEQTTAALKTIDVSGLTMTHAQGRGRHPTAPMSWRGCEHEAFLPNVTIDMVVPDDLVDDVIRVVMETARTGHMGDGRIFVMPVEEAYTIRTRAGGVD